MVVPAPKGLEVRGNQTWCRLSCSSFSLAYSSRSARVRAELLASSCRRSSSASARCLHRHSSQHPHQPLFPRKSGPGSPAPQLRAAPSPRPPTCPPGCLLAQPLLLLSHLGIEPAPLQLQRLLLLLQLLLTPVGHRHPRDVPSSTRPLLHTALRHARGCSQLSSIAHLRPVERKGLLPMELQILGSQQQTGAGLHPRSVSPKAAPSPG